MTTCWWHFSRAQFLRCTNKSHRGRFHPLWTVLLSLFLYTCTPKETTNIWWKQAKYSAHSRAFLSVLCDFLVCPSAGLIKLGWCHPSCAIRAAQKELLWSQTQVRAWVWGARGTKVFLMLPLRISTKIWQQKTEITQAKSHVTCNNETSSLRKLKVNEPWTPFHPCPEFGLLLY